MSFDLSTLQLCEQACSLLKMVSIEECLKVWHAIGTVVRTQLGANKGVRLGQLGTFSKTLSDDTTFIAASEILKSYKLKTKPNAHPDNIPVSSLNFTQLAQVSGVSRDVAEKVYTKMVQCVGKCIMEGRNILLTIHKVAEISIKNSVMSVAFMSTSSPNSASQPVAALSPRKAPASKPRNSVWSSNRQRAAARDRAATTQEAALAKVVAYKNKTENPAPPQFRPKNNIFSSASDISHTTPPPVPVNPIVHHGEVEYEYNPFDEVKDYKTKKTIKAEFGDARPSSATSVNSVDTMSLLHSPRSQLTAASSQRGSGRGGLSKAQLDYHAATVSQQQLLQRNRRAPSSQEGVGGALGGLDARALAAKALSNGEIVKKVREKIIERGGTSGIRSLQRLLMIMDDNGDKRLSKEELKFGLRDYGIELSPGELDEVFIYFDRDHNGFVDITEFLVGVRGDLNQRRKNIIRMAFDILDVDGSGFVTVEEIADVYDVSQNPEVTSGKKTLREAQLEFMGQWERGEKDGVVTYEEFEDYYKEISASIDGDDYFELMMRNAWRIAGGEGYAANTANLRVLVTQKDGTQKVATVEKELGLKQGDREGIRARLAKQGVDADNIELNAGIDATERPKRGNAQQNFGIKQLETKRGVDVGNPRNAYERNVAALKLAAAFRGRVGRKKALQEKRKAAAVAQRDALEAAEANRPKPKKLIRPVPKKKI